LDLDWEGLRHLLDFLLRVIAVRRKDWAFSSSISLYLTKSNRTMKTAYFRFVDFFKRLEWLPLLIIRLILMHGFLVPAWYKIKNPDYFIGAFAKMDIPAPTVSFYLCLITEALAVVLLPLGLGIRFIAVPLMITMLVAIFAGHWDNGFQATDNGWQVQMYFFFMLFLLFVYGGGKASLDYWIGKRMRK
jgi:putative oxidoreductase